MTPAELGKYDGFWNDPESSPRQAVSEGAKLEDAPLAGKRFDAKPDNAPKYQM